MSAIYRGPTRGYQLTAEDVLWLARGFVGEHGKDCTRDEAKALFHSWMDRFLLVNSIWLKKKYDFYQLLRGHSQALKKAWGDPGSSFCQRNPKDCTAAKIKRRHWVWGLSVAQLKSFGVYKYALEAQNGTLERMIQEPTYDFAACSYVRTQKRPCEGINIGGSCYLTYKCLKAKEKAAILAGEVQIEGVTPEKVGKAGIVIVGALVLYGIYRFFSGK